MKITIISSTEHGGAGYSAKNLQKGYEAIGVHADILTEHKVVASYRGAFGKLRRWWLVRKYIRKNYGYLKNAPQGYDHFSFARTGYRHVQQNPLVKDADILNMHWVSYLLDYPSFFKNLNKPIVWTLHDTNLFTGGCHYNFGCENYLTDCADCPQLPQSVKAYAAKDNLQLKKDAVKRFGPSQMVVVSPSKWLMELSQKSALFKGLPHYHIPNSIDTEVFYRQDQQVSRAKAGLPMDKFIILFVSTSLTEQRKGFDIILKLRDLFKAQSDVLFVAIGQAGGDLEGIYSTGYITEKNKMAQLYNAADVFIVPSREDNLPNTMLEALCCGTPVIGFKTGGIPDAIMHGINGFLVEKENIADIEEYIVKIKNYKDIFDKRQIAADAREKYALARQASTYKEVIDEVFTRRGYITNTGSIAGSHL